MGESDKSRQQEIAELKARLADLERQQEARAEQLDKPARPATASGGGGLALIVGILAIIIIGALAFNSSDSPAESPSGQSASADLALNATAPVAEADATSTEAPAEVSNWSYDSRKDEMTDRVTRTACVTSTNTVNLDWPYGSVRASLCLRDSPRFGRDAYVRLLGDGQMLCRSYDGCTVKVRFDDRAAQTFSGSGSSDGSSNIIFIDNRTRFEMGLKAADETLIAAEFYQAGVQTMKFPTKGFAWPEND